MTIIIIGAEIDRDRDKIPGHIGILHGWGVTEQWGIERSTALMLDDFLDGTDALNLAERLRVDYGQESVLYLQDCQEADGTHHIILSPGKNDDQTLLDNGRRFTIRPAAGDGTHMAYSVTRDGAFLLD